MHDQRKTSAAFAFLIQRSVLFIRTGKVIIIILGELNPIPKIFSSLGTLFRKVMHNGL